MMSNNNNNNSSSSSNNNENSSSSSTTYFLNTPVGATERDKRATATLAKPESAVHWSWNYFGLYPKILVGKNNKILAACTICRDKFKTDHEKMHDSWEVKYNSSTTKLIQHISTHHHNEYEK